MTKRKSRILDEAGEALADLRAVPISGESKKETDRASRALQAILKHHKGAGTRILHPGEVLAEEFLAPRGLSVERFAGTIGLNVERLSDVIAGTVPVDEKLAIALGQALDTSAEFWINLQSQADDFGKRILMQKGRVPASVKLGIDDDR